MDPLPFIGPLAKFLAEEGEGDKSDADDWSSSGGGSDDDVVVPPPPTHPSNDHPDVSKLILKTGYKVMHKKIHIGTMTAWVNGVSAKSSFMGLVVGFLPCRMIKVLLMRK